MARTLRILLLLLFVGLGGSAFAQTGAIVGKVVDEKNEPVIGAIVEASEGGIVKGGAQTDFDGNYTIKPLSGGRYEVRISYTGYKTNVVTGVIVGPDRNTQLDAKLELNVKELEEFVVKEYKVPLIDKYTTSTVKTAEELEKMPTRSTATMAATAPGVYKASETSGLSIQGARTDGTLYIIDGVQVYGSRGINLGQNAIDQLEVMTSGVSARYGDAIGGVINITTKGPSSVTRGNVTLEHSVDGYNHNLINATVSGPLYSKTVNGVKKPLIGYFLSGDFWYDEDRSPSYYGYYVAKDDVLDRLKERPLVAISNQSGQPVFVSATQFLTKDDLKQVKKQPNADILEARLTGKLDFQLTDNINLTAGGSFNYYRYQNASRGLSMMAPEASPTVNNFTGRGYLRMTQRFGRAPVATEEGAKRPLISNAFYTLQADYQREYQKITHPDHGTDIFKYGYVGKFNTETMPFYALGVDDSTGRTGIRLIADRVQTATTFERSELNPLLANYTSQFYDLVNDALPQNVDQIRARGGLINGMNAPATYSLWNGVGTTVGSYSFASVDQVAVSADASFDLQPGKTKHSIEFGLYYQQRVERGYSASMGVWQLGRQLLNSHISLGSVPTFIVNGQRYSMEDIRNGVVSPSPFDTILYNREANIEAQSAFDRNLRERLGLDPNGTANINIDALDPSVLSLDLFSADELLNSGNELVSYYGYDYLGNVQKGQVNFNDFFTKKDANGNYTRDIGAFRPNYIAGYILDKFTYRDLNFNIGVRIDRFDANTKVLKDPYSLYDVYTVGDNAAAINRINGSTPGNIGNDYVIYVNNNESTNPEIIGYRSGDDWYDPFGNFIQDPALLKEYSGGRDPQPYLVNPRMDISDDTSANRFDPNSSFEDYTPQVNVAPRIQFSFPISDVAMFFAHYDVLVQRPKSFLFTTPLAYYFLTQNTNQAINNPNLKPERMFDYEVGFKQKLTESSAITITGFYKERKDMIAYRPYLYAWPITYYSFGNRDFSTTKGLTLRYDLRRVGNFRMDLAYTLQFADGTASSPTSGSGTTGLLSQLISANVPNLRFTNPLSVDSRHTIVTNLDYRYDDGEGPVIAGAHILENAGLNLLFNARSGEPYTRYVDPISNTVKGSINGSRLPWHYRLDLRVDKNFEINFNKKSAEEGAKPGRTYFVNVYAYITNLLNTRDILGVYPFTGQPDDDGYLASPQGEVFIQNQINPESYVDFYQIAIQNPGFVNLPRRINVGLSFNF